MPGMLLNGRFQDPDTLNAAVNGWNLDFQQLDAGSFESSFQQVGSPHVFLTTCWFNRRIEQRGCAPEGYMTFGLPLRDDIRLRRMGQSVEGREVVFFRSGEDVDSISEGDFGAQTISISFVRLEEAAELRGFSSACELIADGVSQLMPDGARRELRATAAEFSRKVERDPILIENPQFLADLETDLVNLVLDGSSRGESTHARPMARSRSQALKKALEVIADRCQEPVSVSQLQQAAGVSPRTLLYAFKEEFGLSPKEYLQVYRMRKVRQALVNASAYKQSVSDLANVWGFWHMGQFAADYKKLFGELPSVTVKRVLR